MTKRSVADRFWSKVDRSGGPDSCWLWTAAKSTKGYGFFGCIPGVKGMRGSHRVAYALSRLGGVLPALHVLHSCDTPACCNPAHLWLGTNADNVRDKVSKNRSRVSAGVCNPNVALTTIQVQRIRLVGSALPRSRLAKTYRVSNGHIRRILLGISWANLGSKQALI